MVSFQTPFSPDMMRKTSRDQLEDSSKKRKLDLIEPQGAGDQDTLENKRSKAEESTESALFDMELHLETPLPLEWQRCLDIQSGQIHFYNTRTHTRTCKDPRRSLEPPSPAAHMSLDLELNLPCDSVRKTNAIDDDHQHHHQFNKHNSVSPTRGSVDDDNDDKKMKPGGSGARQSKLSWLAVDEDEEQQEEEMVATVCMRCHMLVMLCKSAPACPNCKFMHPTDQGPPQLFKQRLSLLC